MTITKGEVRTAAFHEAGCQLDDMVEATKADVLRCEGAISASSKLIELTQALAGHVQKDVEEGKYPLEVAKIVQHYVSRAVVVGEAYKQSMVVQRQQTQGSVAGLERAVGVLKKLHENETRKADAELAAPDPRAQGSGSLKQQRLAAAAESLSAEAPPGEPASVAAGVEPAPTQVPAPTNGRARTRTRGRAADA